MQQIWGCGYSCSGTLHLCNYCNRYSNSTTRGCCAAITRKCSPGGVTDCRRFRQTVGGNVQMGKLKVLLMQILPARVLICHLSLLLPDVLLVSTWRNWRSPLNIFICMASSTATWSRKTYFSMHKVMSACAVNTCYYVIYDCSHLQCHMAFTMKNRAVKWLIFLIVLIASTVPLHHCTWLRAESHRTWKLWYTDTSRQDTARSRPRWWHCASGLWQGTCEWPHNLPQGKCGLCWTQHQF